MRSRSQSDKAFQRAFDRAWLRHNGTLCQMPLDFGARLFDLSYTVSVRRNAKLQLITEQEAIELKLLWIAVFCTALVWSGINPKDYTTWILEVSPAIIGLVVLAVTYHAFPLTKLTYSLILVHSIILMVGGHYTYAEVPLFDEFKTLFGFERNNYDKVGHFAQGFVPAMIAREIMVRKAVVNGRGWMNFLIVCCCLALSAFYELIEWTVALLSDEAAEAFLGTQGYVWDTQSDMGYALLGAIVALICLSTLHDRLLLESGYLSKRYD